MYQREQAVIHDPACMWRCGTYSDALSNLSAPKEYSNSGTGAGRQATPTEATTSVEAVGSSSPKQRHPRESVCFDSTGGRCLQCSCRRYHSFYNSWVLILFDLGATHSFIRTAYALNLGLSFENLEQALNVDLPTGEQLGINRVCKGCVLRIEEHKLIMDLVALDLKGCDVIFGMNLLFAFRTLMDCFRKQITFQLPRGVVFSFINDRSSFHQFLLWVVDS